MTNLKNDIQEDVLKSWLADNILALNTRAIDETIEYFLKTSREPRYAQIIFEHTSSISYLLNNRDSLIPFIEVSNENCSSEICRIVSRYYDKKSHQRPAEDSR